MNAPKSSRYHRARRRTDAASLAAVSCLLTAVLLTPASVWLRTALNGSPAAYALVLFAFLGVVLLPFAWYRGHRLERQYELTHTRFRNWLAGQIKTAALALPAAAALAGFIYWSMRWPSIWWLIAALGCATVMAVLTAAAPLLILPFLQQTRPVGSERLLLRLDRLSARAGVPVLSVHELPMGERTRRARAALVGAGSTRRILLSDTLLANYSDGEIEAVMAHEIGHHVHHDLLKTSLVELLLLVAGFRVAAAALDGGWRWLGLTSPADPAGMPLVVLAMGSVALIATPFLNAWSRGHERRADRFALETASEPEALIAAVRRMSAQNLAEDRPSSAAFLLFHSHPTAEERIAAAREVLSLRGR